MLMRSNQSFGNGGFEIKASAMKDLRSILRRSNQSFGNMAVEGDDAGEGRRRRCD
ncbi:hypothetical protein U1Q18_050190, partial [Sarracenia purpurea var. burkii]